MPKRSHPVVNFDHPERSLDEIRRAMGMSLAEHQRIQAFLDRRLGKKRPVRKAKAPSGKLAKT